MIPIDDILGSIARYLDQQAISSFATTGKIYDAWRKDAIAKDSKSLTLYINNILKNSKTEEEVADHLCRFVRTYTTSFDLMLTHSEITDTKLSAIADKFLNLDRLTYIRPTKLQPETRFRKVVRKIVKAPFVLATYALIGPFIFYDRIMKGPFREVKLPYIVNKTASGIDSAYQAAEQAFGCDMHLEKIASLFPAIRKLDVQLSDCPKIEKGEYLFSLPQFKNLQELSLTGNQPNEFNEHMFAQCKNITYLHIDGYASRSFILHKQEEGVPFPSKLQKLHKRGFYEEDIKKILNCCPELQTLSCEYFFIHDAPISPPCESLRKFKVLDLMCINTQNLFLSFPKLTHLALKATSVAPLAGSTSLEKLTLYTYTRALGLDVLPAKFPNLKSLKIVWLREDAPQVDIPQEFEEVKQGITSKNKQFIRLNRRCNC